MYPGKGGWMTVPKLSGCVPLDAGARKSRDWKDKPNSRSLDLRTSL